MKGKSTYTHNTCRRFTSPDLPRATAARRRAEEPIHHAGSRLKVLDAVLHVLIPIDAEPAIYDLKQEQILFF